MSRILGIDYGEKKIGFSLSDEGQNIASPKTTQPNVWKYVKEYMEDLILKENISEIVVGLPLSLRGEETDFGKKVLIFVEKLKENFKLPINLENEIFTTQQAKSTESAPKEKLDASAAALILQTYLDKKKNK